MRWLTEIAQGLAIAHDAGIIHRDLKAENILINQRKVAKITDLGIAKSQDFNATLTDHVAGSYCSMSPEQAMGEAIDFKSDLFSFGILAYQLLCGAHPFGDTNNKLQLMQRIISHPPTAPSKHNPNLPAEINDLLGQLLSKDPTKRPDNTHWVAAQFEALSHLQLQNEFVSDETQALIPNGTAANQSNVKNTGIKSAVKTQDHRTFETHFVAVNATPKKTRWLSIKNYVADNKISVGFGLFSVLILAAVVIWQLQPKPPKYIAVIPPKLTAEGMQESQQELVKGAVYDAIQQSVIQLDGYYLIPRDEIADVNADNETVRRATAADELITTEVQCRIETCTITLVRLTSESTQTNSRLRVDTSKTVDVLTDNYLAIATITQNILSGIYSKSLIKAKEAINEKEYIEILTAHKNYRTKGADSELLTTLNNLDKSTKNNSTAQNLYRDVSLDLHYETKNKEYLINLEKYLDDVINKESIAYLYNYFHLSIAKRNFIEAEKFKQKITSKIPSQSLEDELNAHIKMAENNYEEAIKFYKRALSAKKTSDNLYYLANAYWYSGNTLEANHYLNESISLAPNYYWAHSLMGIVALYSGDIDQALKSFEIAITQRPDDSANLNNLGLCYLLIRDPQKALTLFNKAVALAPLNTTYLLNKADAENLAEKSEATETYKKVIKMVSDKSNDSPSLRNKAQAYAHIQQFDGALTLLKAIEKFDPQNTEVLYTAAIVHTQANNFTAAIFNIENTLKNGMHPIWFNFLWFDALCKDNRFVSLMQKHGETNRCPL